MKTNLTVGRYVGRLGAAAVIAVALMDSRAGAADKITVGRTGPEAGHYLVWRGRPVLLLGDSVTQGWMECGTNFNQAAYVEALAARGIDLLMLWAYKGTHARWQEMDRRIGYDAPELWPWIGSPDARTFDLRQFRPAYFERLRQLVAHAERRGIVVLITVHDGWTKTCFEGHPFNRVLGNGPLADRRHYVALAQASEMPEEFAVQWYNPRTGQTMQGGVVTGGVESFRAPFEGDAVLHLRH